MVKSYWMGLLLLQLSISAHAAPQFDYIVVDMGIWSFEREDPRVKEALKKAPKAYSMVRAAPNASKEGIEKYATEEETVHSAILNDLGRTGWELVSILQRGEKVLAYFKRQVAPPLR